MMSGMLRFSVAAPLASTMCTGPERTSMMAWAPAAFAFDSCGVRSVALTSTASDATTVRPLSLAALPMAAAALCP
jgi:hypothetical protein